MLVAVLIFIIGYLAIAFEHGIHLNKAASALITGVLCWLCYFMIGPGPEQGNPELAHHLSDIASILFFLVGAMTIVEVIDSYGGFDVITYRITTNSKPRLLIIISILTFFLSAILDNLTTAIVMTSLIQKLIPKREDRLWFAGMIVIAANAGGAWSPLGDVTTTMLWIGGQISALRIAQSVFLPSIIACVAPLLLLCWQFRSEQIEEKTRDRTNSGGEVRIILVSGIALLIFVPLFKIVTDMPPFMGMMLALGLMWIIASFIHKRRRSAEEKFAVYAALQRIDTPSILFFLGILLAVAALQSFGALRLLAEFLEQRLPNHYAIAAVLGVVSAFVDNVPLVAGAQGMYDLAQFPTDDGFWRFLAFTTGTGGSAIIIGSAAGVAVMGIERISFMWYLKKISLLALLGFAAGSAVFLSQEFLMIH
jgi:Na+/H+ antiporter NhaD/arsenite permease-like protein